jgi:hypothetical protein
MIPHLFVKGIYTSWRERAGKVWVDPIISKAYRRKERERKA